MKNKIKYCFIHTTKGINNSDCILTPKISTIKSTI